MKSRYRSRILIWLLASGLFVAAAPGVALAGDDNSEEDTFVAGEVLTTVPVLGAGLNITIVRGEGGSIESVALDPAAGATIVKEGEHKVVFLLGDGNTRVKIKSREGSIKTKVTADSTADVTGPGSWSADVFGTGLVTVPYTISFDGNAPIITVGAITAPADVVAEVGEPRIHEEDGEEFSYRIKVRLTSGEERAKLTLVAKTEIDEDDGQVEVRVMASLSDRDRHRDHDDSKRDDGRDEFSDGDGRDRDGDYRVHDGDDDRGWDRDDRDGGGDRDDD
jgi:hypothetical protein